MAGSGCCPFVRGHRRREGAWSALVGLLTGLVTGLTGVFVVPAVPYLQALGLPREMLIQALGLSFTVATLALGLGLFIHGGSQSLDLGLTWLMLLPALLGLEIGRRIRRRLSEAVFRRLFFLGLLALGRTRCCTGCCFWPGESPGRYARHLPSPSSLHAP